MFRAPLVSYEADARLPDRFDATEEEFRKYLRIYPELVGKEDGYKTTNYNGPISVLIEAVTEQQ